MYKRQVHIRGVLPQPYGCRRGGGGGGKRLLEASPPTGLAAGRVGEMVRLWEARCGGAPPLAGPSLEGPVAAPSPGPLPTFSWTLFALLVWTFALPAVCAPGLGRGPPRAR